MNEQAERPRRSITDSPWYWVYLFAAAGLAALFLMGPRFGDRQAQIENKYQRRQHVARQLAGQSANTPLSSPDDTLIRLWPLSVVLGAIAAAAIFGLWRSRRVNRRSPTAGGSP